MTQLDRASWAALSAAILLALRVILAEDPKWALCWPTPVLALWGFLLVGLMIAELTMRALVGRRPSNLQPFASFGFTLGLAIVVIVLAPDFVGEAFTWKGDRSTQLLLSMGAGAGAVAASLLVVVAAKRRMALAFYALAAIVVFCSATLLSLVTTQTLSSIRPEQIAYQALGAVAWLALSSRSTIAPNRRGRFVARWVTLVVVLVALLVGHGLLHRQRPVPDGGSRTNIFLVTVDTLRADAATGPGLLETLSKDGVAFSLAFAQSPWTQPSVASFLTSRYPSEVNFGRLPEGDGALISNVRILDPSAPTLATVVEREGYATLAVLTNSLLTARYGFNNGFERYAHVSRGFTYQGLALVSTVFALRNLVEPGWRSKQANSMTEFALRELDHLHAGGRPMFLWLHYNDPHWPYEAPGETLHFSQEEYARLHEGIPNAQLIQDIRSAYDREVKYTDAAIERFIDGLRRRGLYESSLIVFTSDHGEEFWEHGRNGHGFNLHNALVQVPLIVKLPFSSHAGKRFETQVSLLDLVPTILAAAGAVVSNGFEGSSLLELLDGGGQGSRVVFSESVSGSAASGSPYEQKSVRDDRYSVIDTPALGTREVYDRRSDPGEFSNIEQESGPWKDLARHLEEWTNDMLEAAAATEVAIRPMDQELERQLKALGYID